VPPLRQKDAEEFIQQRASEWQEFQRDWRWLQDSLEGGCRYKYANYRDDPLGERAGAPGLHFHMGETKLVYGEQTDRNLVPHLSETSVEGADLYAMRLARTPVPRVVGRALARHLSRVYAHEVTREGPQPLLDWWLDVDGAGTPIDKWMRKAISPLFLVLGQLDLCFDHPAAPEGVEIRTAADARRFGLDRCVASFILPENMLWWEVDRQTRRYVQCLVYERCDTGPRFRHWTAEESNAYDSDGEWLREVSRPHPFGRVPIVRVFDERKHRCGNTGQSRYESVAELQKAIYNARSELILSDVLQSHAILQGPPEFVRGDGAIEVGPRGVLPVWVDGVGNALPWSFLDPPKGAQQEIRQHILDFQDEADRDSALLKPAGMTTGSTVAQSGISKAMDMRDGNDYLSEVAETLADCERACAEMVLLVTSDGKSTPADSASVKVVYPKEFGLTSAEDLAAGLVELQGIAAAQSDLPETMAEGLKRYVATLYPGLSDERLAELHEEIEAFVARRAADAEMNSESLAASIGVPRNSVTPAPGSGSPGDGDGMMEPVQPVNMTDE
jgi:hypothetical protein